MMRKFLVVMILFTFLVGCSSKSAFKPQPIDPSVDSCDQCHMGIQNVKASAEVILKDGTPKKFDDIGCMTVYLQGNLEQAANVFVHDYMTGEWIDMYEAVFIQGSSVKSPMNYGFVAFSSQKDAETFQAENGGKLYTPEDLLKADVQALKDAGHGAGQDNGHDTKHDTEHEMDIK